MSIDPRPRARAISRPLRVAGSRRSLRGLDNPVVLVHRAGESDSSRTAVRGVLTHPSAVLVLDPPAILLERTAELVAVIAQGPSAEAVRAPVDRILVEQVLHFAARDGTTNALSLVLRSPSRHRATPLNLQVHEFLEVLAEHPNDAGPALVQAGLLAPEHLEELDPALQARLEEERLPAWKSPADGSDESDSRKAWWCFLVRCR